MGRTLAIGLDGCSWNVLEPLLETGELPALQSLRDNGASGVLESTIPFFTGPAWVSFATGASPAAHGIYDFMALREGGRLSVARQADLRRRTYYEQLGAEGKRSVLVNMPLDQDGCDGATIVNSWLTDDDARRFLPLGRREQYTSLLSAYRLFPVDPKNVDELCAIEEARFDLARELFLREPWDHFFVLFSSTDWMGHAGTGHFLAGDPTWRANFLRLYKQLDGYIAWFLSQAPDAHAVVLSDHGQCEEEYVYRVNQVLRDLGHAEVVEEPAEDSPFFVDRRPKGRQLKVPGALSRFRQNPIVRPVAVRTKRLLKKRLGVEVVGKRQPVDRARSRAFSPTDASFAVYTRDVCPKEIEEIREAMLEHRLPDGTPALDGVWTVEELYGRVAGPDEPTLLFSPAIGVRPATALRESVIDFPREAGKGCHQRDGIVLMGGPQVVQADLGSASIYDLAPTMLWAMGAAVPAEGDGRVLFEAFAPEFADALEFVETEAAPLSVGAVYEDDPDGEVAARLRALGYI